MKPLLFFNLFVFMIIQLPFDIIGKHISEIKNTHTSIEETFYGSNMYKLDSNGSFLDKKYEGVFLTLDTNEVVTNFTIFIDEIIDASFYNLMVSQYGMPYKLYNRGAIQSEEQEEVKNDFFSSPSRKVSILKECTFDESPVLIIWKKDEYDIYVMIGDKNDTFKKTKIVFGKNILIN